MKIMVVGGAGYVGSMLVRFLLARGDNVAVTDNMVYGDHGLSEIYCPLLETRNADAMLCKPSWFAGMDAVVNLAGISNDPTAEYLPSTNWLWNVALPARVAEAALAAGVKRLVYASSSSIYHAEDAQIDAELAEGYPVKPQWHYSASKYAGETASLTFNRPGQFDVCALRKGTISGPSFRHRFDLLLNTMHRNAIRDRAIKLHGGGWVYRPLLGITDAVSAYGAVLDAPTQKISGRAFNVTSSNSTVRAYAEVMQRVLADEFGVKVTLEDAPPPEIVRSYRISSRKFTEQLGWQPHDSAETITRELHQAYLGTHPAGIKLPEFNDPLAENIMAIKGGLCGLL